MRGNRTNHHKYAQKDLTVILQQSILEAQAKKLLATELPPRFKKYRIRHIIKALEMNKLQRNN